MGYFEITKEYENEMRKGKMFKKNIKLIIMAVLYQYK